MSKIVLVVDIDTDRDYQISIQHAVHKDDDEIEELEIQNNDPVTDMAWLCEAICLLIHGAEKDKIRKSPDSLRKCIHHLEQGTFDASYFVETIHK